MSEVIKLSQTIVGHAGGEFGKIFFPELTPLHGMCVEPFPQLVGRGNVFQPCVQRGRFFRQTPRPEPIYKDTRAVLERWFVVDAFEPDRHARCILTLNDIRCRQCDFLQVSRSWKVGLRGKYGHFTFVLAAVLIALTLLFACDAEPRKTDAELGLNAQQARGRRVYDARCAECHYAYSKRDLRGPSLHGLFQKKYMTSGIPANDERVIDIIEMGRAKMPGFANKLTVNQIADLVSYLHTL